ncbi:MAG: hypothetical protein KJ072_13550 [Verrucomicrobia bacterium]|nr:hypothetical protein [Verrucomicrobiota bacterium]
MNYWVSLLCLFAVVGVIAAEHRYEYDAAGRLVVVSLPEGRTLRYRYDAAGNLLERAWVEVIDSDEDQLPDDWEQLHFGSLLEGGQDDFDGDGLTNLEEYQAGTNPGDAGSLLRILRLDAGHLAGTQLEVSSVAGRSYVIEARESVADGVWVERGTVRATGSVLIWTDTDTASPGRYYRVRLAP